jgi:cell division protein FtsI/penicillin-binding protein 2
LFESHPDRWRCWQIHGSSARMAHGQVNVVEALTGSCNIFMYRLGERLGVDTLCSVFDMVGIGRSTGIGLREEVTGINPTPSWLMTHKNVHAGAGVARLYAIGQGEVSLTPIQVANLMATYATGTYRGLTLIGSGADAPEWTLPGEPEDWHAIRRGMYGVVNDPDGTAYHQAHFEHPRYVLLGKTGSATAHPWPTEYQATFADSDGNERTERFPAGSQTEAIGRLEQRHPEATFDPNDVVVASRWPILPPTSGEHHSHAWFGGYMQPRLPRGGADWSAEPHIAFAALVEFGGSGGRTSGPLAKRIASAVLDVFGEDLAIPPVVSEGRVR